MRKNKIVFPPKRPPEQLKCTYRGLRDIDLAKLVHKAGEQINQTVECIPDNNRIYMPCFIPAVSLSAVQLSVYRYFGDSDLYGYEAALRIPCAQEDLQLFCAVIRLLKENCRADGRHIAMGFDGCFAYPGHHDIMKTDEEIIEKWKEGMDAFFDRFNQDKSTFYVHNGRLQFVFYCSGFQLPGRDKAQQEALFASIRQHIWQPVYQAVDNHCIYVYVSTDTLPKTRKLLPCVLWTNQQPLLIPLGSYVVFESTKGWRAVRPKRWHPILEPFMIQYDDFNKNLLPQIDKEQFEHLKAALVPLASSLQVRVSVANSQATITAHVPMKR